MGTRSLSKRLDVRARCLRPRGRGRHGDCSPGRRWPRIRKDACSRLALEPSARSLRNNLDDTALFLSFSLFLLSIASSIPFFFLAIFFSFLFSPLFLSSLPSPSFCFLFSFFLFFLFLSIFSFFHFSFVLFLDFPCVLLLSFIFSSFFLSFLFLFLFFSFLFFLLLPSSSFFSVFFFLLLFLFVGGLAQNRIVFWSRFRDDFFEHSGKKSIFGAVSRRKLFLASVTLRFPTPFLY